MLTRPAEGGSAPATAETFTYDDRGLLLTATGAAGDSSFSYTADGSMATRIDAAGTTTYTYDTAGRLFNLTDPASATMLTDQYNTLNQVSSVTYGSGRDQRTFDYDTTHRLRAMRGLHTDRTEQVIIAGHAFTQNLRRGHYELGLDVPPTLRVAAAFIELAHAI